MSDPIKTLIEAARAAVAYHCSSYLDWSIDNIEKELQMKAYRSSILELEYARRAALEALEKPVPVCHWRETTRPLYQKVTDWRFRWETECGEIERPFDSKGKYCRHCGKPLVVVPWTKPEEEVTS